MSPAFDRDRLLDAFDQIGRAAVLAGTKLQIAVYGGSALMLASNFRFATEDVDVSELEHPLPGWLATVVDKIAKENGWQEGWFNDGVAFHLSSLADRALDHLEWDISAGGQPTRACGFGPVGRIFACPEIKGHAGNGPSSWRNGAGRHSQFDASRGHLDRRGGNSPAWSLLSNKCCFFGKAAVLVGEHESQGRHRAAQIPLLKRLKGSRQGRRRTSNSPNSLTPSIWRKPIGIVIRRSSASRN